MCSLPWSGIARADNSESGAAVATPAAETLSSPAVSTGAVQLPTPSLWPVACDTVDVVAERPFATEGLSPARGFVQVIPLGSNSPASSDLGDLLDRAAGVSVRRYGGLGSMSLASIRGSSPSQVQVYIDDVPLSAASDAVANLALLPAHLFDRVEVRSGPLAEDSQDAAAGSIHLVSPESFDVPLRFRFGVGSFGTSNLSALGGGRRGPLALLIAGGRLASRGNYTYVDRGGTTWESSDDRTVRRKNNAFRQEDLLVRMRALAPGAIQFDYIGHALWKDAGVPGTENLQTRAVHDQFRRWMHSVSMGPRAVDAPTWNWKLSAHRQDDQDHYSNLLAEAGLGRAETQSRLIADGLNGSIGRMFTLSHADPTANSHANPGSAPVTVAARIDLSVLREQWLLEDRLRDSVSPTRGRGSRSAGLEGGFHAGRLGFSATERWLFVHERLDGVSTTARVLPHGRLGASVDLARGVVVRGGWGQTIRMPSFTELFGQGGIQVGNPDLVPERGVAWDAGLNLSATPAPALRTFAEIAVFGTRMREAIVWIQNSQRTARPQNLERTRVIGTQLLLRGTWQARPNALVGLTLSGTFQDARDDGPSVVYHGNRLPYLPAAQGSLEARFESSRMRIAYAIDAESSIERDRYNSAARRRGGRALHDIETAWKVPGRPVEASLTVKNLTNRQAQDVDGFPLPGRAALVELTWTVR